MLIHPRNPFGTSEGFVTSEGFGRGVRELLKVKWGLYFDIVGIFVIVRDITELKDKEELIRKSEKLSIVGELAVMYLQ